MLENKYDVKLDKTKPELEEEIQETQKNHNMQTWIDIKKKKKVLLYQEHIWKNNQYLSTNSIIVFWCTDKILYKKNSEFKYIAEIQEA